MIKGVKEICNKPIVNILKSSYDVDDLENWLEEKAEKAAMKDIKGYGKEYVDNLVKDLDEADKHKELIKLQKVYFAYKKGTILEKRERAFKDRRMLLQTQVRDNMDLIVKFLNRQKRVVSGISDIIKDSVGIDNLYNEPDAIVPDASGLLSDVECIDARALIKFKNMLNEVGMKDGLNKLQSIYINMISNFNFIQKTRSIVDYLKLMRNAKIKYVAVPDTFDVDQFIKKSVESIIS